MDLNKPNIAAGKSTKWWHFNLKWLKSSKPSATEEEVPFQFDVPFWFPNQEEKAPTGSYTARQTVEMRPNLSVPTPVGAASFGGVGTTEERSSTTDTLIFRWGAREYNSDTLVKLRWSVGCPLRLVFIVKYSEITFFEHDTHRRFGNSGSDYYPASHSLILLMGMDASATPPFTFKLNLLKSLKVTSRATPFFARLGGAPGWEFQIRGNYEPTLVDNMLRAYKEKSPKHEDITLVKLAQAHLNVA